MPGKAEARLPVLLHEMREAHDGAYRRRVRIAEREEMNKQEFIKTASSCGYGCERTIEMYTKGRKEFTEDDFIGLFRFHERFMESQNRSNMKGKWRNYDGTLSTKHLVDTADDRKSQ